MFFQRLAAKTDLVNTVVAQTHGLPDSLNGSVSDMLVGVCEVCSLSNSCPARTASLMCRLQMRGRLSSLSTLCKRFAAILRRCDVDSFLNIGRLYQEIAPMEKRIDMHIDLLRREEFREMECVNDVVKCVLISIRNRGMANFIFHRIHAQFDHISETYFAGFDFDLGERELGYALSFDHDLDMFAASLGLVKTSIEAAMKEDGELRIAMATGARSDGGRTRRGFRYGRLRPRGNLVCSSEESPGPVPKRKEPIEVRL